MDQPYPEPIKHREIGFRNPHPDPQQAQSAVLVLADVEGVISVSIPKSSQDAIHIEISH